jgi:hypothetical protein
MEAKVPNAISLYSILASLVITDGPAIAGAIPMITPQGAIAASQQAQVKEPGILEPIVTLDPISRGYLKLHQERTIAIDV